MRIVNPTFGVSAAGGEEQTSATVDWLKDPIVLFSNSKPNARELLEGIRDELAALRPVEDIGYALKDSASQPAPPELLEEVAGRYRAALLAIAD